MPLFSTGLMVACINERVQPLDNKDPGEGGGEGRGMDTENVDTLAVAVNGTAVHRPTVDEVVAWVKSQAGKADMGDSAARIRITSLQSMAEQVATDGSEPVGDALWIQDNIERLRERWLRRNPEGKADTAGSYAARANATIRAYIEWSADPYAYDKKKSASAKPAGDGVKKPAASKKPKAPVVAVPTAAGPAASGAPMAPKAETRNFPLGDGRAILFQLPPEGVTFADVKKFAVHLLTLAKDFDISNADQAQVFAMVVRGSRD